MYYFCFACLYVYVALYMALYMLPCIICYPVYVTLYMLPCICCPVYVALYMLPCICCPVYVALYMLPCICYPVYVALGKHLKLTLKLKCVTYVTLGKNLKLTLKLKCVYAFAPSLSQTQGKGPLFVSSGSKVTNKLERGEIEMRDLGPQTRNDKRNTRIRTIHHIYPPSRPQQPILNQLAS